jgi:hypothetical protein
VTGRVVRIDTPRGLGERWVPRYRTLYRVGALVVGLACFAFAAAGDAWLFFAACGVVALVHAGPRGNAHTIEVDNGFVTYHAGLMDRQVPWSEIEGFAVRRHRVGETTRDRIIVLRRGGRTRPLDSGSTNAPIARAELHDIVKWLNTWHRTRVRDDAA